MESTGATATVPASENITTKVVYLFAPSYDLLYRSRNTKDYIISTIEVEILNEKKCSDFCLVASCVLTELKDTVAVSSSSLNSENPYATIKDLPGLPFCPPESSYMEMKSAVPRERAYTEISPPPFNTATLRRGEQLPL